MKGKTSVCAICGSMIVLGSAPSIECRDGEWCPQLAIHQAHAPEREPAPMQTVELSPRPSFTVTLSLPPLHERR
jgi:hypothetical protein